MKRTLLLIAVVLVAALIFQASRPADVVPPGTVVLEATSRGPVHETVKAYGTLQPLRRVNVGSQVSGLVTAVYVDYNSLVKEGQLLAEIEPSLFTERVAIQEAAIARQRGDIANQEVLLADLQKQLDRTQQLFDRGLANQRQLDQAVLAIKTREAQIESARTQLVQSEANLAAAQLNLSYTKIYSPIDGVVIQSRVMVGQTVQASMTTPTLFQLATAVETLKLSAGVDEADIGRVRPGQLVEFQVGTYGQELFKGTVEAIRLNASTSNNVVTYPVWINVPNPDLRLRPSMTAQVFIRVSQTGEVVRIPNKALMFRPTRAVYTALGAPMVEQNPVRALDLQADRIADPNAKSDILVDPNADSIDELFAPLPKADARATVWTWDETNRRLNPVPVRVGVTDGETTELLAGNLEAGDELVTGVLVPETNAPRPGQNPLVGNQRRIR